MSGRDWLRGSVPGIISLLLGLMTAPAAAQESTPLRDRVARVFLDCNQPVCDPDRIRQTVDFVTWVSQPEAADAHVLIDRSSSETGSATYRLRFFGRGELLGEDLVLTVDSPDWAVAEERTRAYLATLRLGLARYAVYSSAASTLTVVVEPSEIERPTPEEEAAAPPVDPWRSWVFQIDLDGELESESRSSEYEAEATVRATRITESFKFTATAYASESADFFDLGDRDFESLAAYRSASMLVALMAGSHWAYGMRGDVVSSSFDNTRISYSSSAVIERNLFPYSDFTTRNFVLQYSIGMEQYDFRERTIYGVTADTFWRHRFLVDARTRQTWGSLGLSAVAAQYLPETELYQLRLGGEIDYRIFRGLSLALSGEYDIIRDQIGLPARGADEDDILLRRRAVATDYELKFEAGIRIRFGSQLVGVVNSSLDRR